MEQFPIAAQRRDKQGTGAARAYRREGLIPGVLYGHGEEAVPILVPARELSAFLKHHSSVASLNIDGQSGEAGMAALLKQVDRDPLSRAVLSVDFLRVSLTETVTVDVPLVLVGEAPGVKIEGGVLEQTLHQLSVSCLPTQIPESIEVDVSNLSSAHSLHVRDVVVPEGLTINTPEDEAVATIARAVRAEDLEVAAEEGAAVAAEAEAEGASSEEEGK